MTKFPMRPLLARLTRLSDVSVFIIIQLNEINQLFFGLGLLSYF